MIKYLLFLFCICFCKQSFSQNSDSIYIDTVHFKNKLFDRSFIRSPQITYKDLIGIWKFEEDKKIAFPSELTLNFQDSINMLLTEFKKAYSSTYMIDTIGRFSRLCLTDKDEQDKTRTTCYFIKFINSSTLKMQFHIIYRDGAPDYEEGFKNAPTFIKIDSFRNTNIK